MKTKGNYDIVNKSVLMVQVDTDTNTLNTYKWLPEVATGQN